MKRLVHGNIEVRGKIETNLPASVVDGYRTATERTEKHENRRFRLEIATLIVSSLGALLTLGLAIQAFRGNNIAHESLISVQRAYITFKSLTPSRSTIVGHPELTQLGFTAVWENSGTTPAINIISAFAAERMNREPTQEEFVPVFPLPLEATSGPLAPKGILESPVRSFPEVDLYGTLLSQPNAGQRRTYISQSGVVFWGWVVYRDIFRESPVHVTEFCDLLAGAKRDVGVEPDFTATFRPCRHHNCEDQFCSDYSMIVSKANDLWKRDSLQ